MDTDDKSILTKAIKEVAHKNIKQISEWQKQNPEYKDPDSKQNDKYQKILFNAMSGSTKEESDKNYEKIIRNVIKNTVIEK
jgi:phosphoglycerol transferase MdoB-like AlkP superfamily enzyme